LRSSAIYWMIKFFKSSANSHIGRKKSLNFSKHSGLLLTTYFKKHQQNMILQKVDKSAYLHCLSIAW
jgi:glycerol kinase